jgi:ATP synthase protein I
MDDGDRLRDNIERQAKRIAQAEKERPTLLGQTVFLGTLALLLVAPMVGGAYLGRWLDSLATGYQDRWTISLVIAGLLIGAWSVYLYIKRH